MGTMIIAPLISPSKPLPFLTTERILNFAAKLWGVRGTVPGRTPTPAAQA